MPVASWSSLTDECLVDTLCLDCDHCQGLNLSRLAARGYLSIPLIGLPLAYLGLSSTRRLVIVSGYSYRA